MTSREIDWRDRAAKRLLRLIDYGPDKRFPFPNEKYEEALAVVDALQALNGDGPHSFTPAENGKCIDCGEGPDHPNHSESW